jgi:co-chaperonin GroES (HSP10)
MTEENKVDLFTLGLVVGDDGKMQSNNRQELADYLEANQFVQPLNFYFLVATPTVKGKTKGGIILAQESKDNALVGNNIGRILGMGGTVGGSTDNFADCRKLKVGDYIGYNPHAGSPQDYRGHKLICMADQAIRIIVHDPTQHTDGIFKTYSIEGVN